MSAILLLFALLAGTNIEASETCGRKLDVAFMVDGSTSICGGPGPCEKWRTFLEFCKSIVNALTIGSDQTRVAFLTYGNSIEVKWNLGQYKDSATLKSAIDNVPYPGGELSDVASVAKIILDVFLPVIGEDRLGVQNILIIMSDGAPLYPPQAWAVASTAVQIGARAGVFILCGPPHCIECCARGVSSPPKRANETYFMMDDLLKIEQFRDNLVKKFCTWTLPQGLEDWVNQPTPIICPLETPIGPILGI
jgi:hypothetical protein